MANLIYSYDDSSGSFSPLPASPFLLPAIFLWAFFKFATNAKEIKKITNSSPIEMPEKFYAYKKRYHEMIEIQGRRDFTDKEHSEFHSLIYPPWGEPGEVWTY